MGLVHSGDDGVVFQARTGEYRLVPRGAGAIEIDTPHFPLGSAPGKPWLPWRKVFVAVPPGVHVSVESEASDIRTQSAVRLWSASASPGEGLAGERWQLPSTWVELLRTGYIRDQRVAVCAIRPFLYDTLTATLRIAGEMRGRVLFTGEHRGITLPGGHFEKVYENLLLNYPSSVHWRRARTVESDTGWQPPFPSRRFYLDTEGLYRLTYGDLSGHIPADHINPHRLCMWKDGSMVPLYISGQEDLSDTTFEQGEYLQFYGTFCQADDPEERLAIIPGHFTDEAVYWLCWNEESPLRAVEQDATPGAPPEANEFLAVAHAEENSYVNRSGHGTAEPHEWYWGKFFASGEERQYSIDVTAPAGESRAVLRLKVVGYSSSAHRADLEVNGAALSAIEWQGEAPYLWDSEAAGLGPVPVHEGTNTVTLVADDEDAYFFVDWVEIVYRRRYEFLDGSLQFRGPVGEPQGTYLFTIQGAGGSTPEIVDVLEGKRLVGIQGGDAAVFQAAASESSYFAAAWGEGFLGLDDVVRVEEEIPRHPPLSDSLVNGADYVIVAHHDFLDAASDLKSFWETRRYDVTVDVVQIQDVYDEFNYGVFHPLAIRDMLSFAYAHWDPAPSYVLFLGDACWDYRHYLRSTVKENYVPSWGIPAQDNALLDVDGGDVFADFFAGRLPAETPDQASKMVQKLMDYVQSAPLGLWRKTVLFVNGGFDLEDAAELERWSEQLIDGWVESPPFIGKPVRVYKGNENYWPHFYNARVRSAVDSGCVVVAFMGHGGTHTWDLMLENADLLLMENGRMLPFVLSPTCFTGDFGDRRLDVFGEDFLRRDDAEHGAIGFWGSAGLATNSDMRLINGSFLSHALNPEPWTNGEACYMARAAGANVIASRLYNLLGDPLVTLAVPDLPDLVVTPGDIQLDREEPGEGERVKVRARLSNWGAEVSDSLTILLGTDEGQAAFSKRLGPFGFQTEVALDWDTSGLLGDHVLWVTMDAYGEIDELREDNNDAQSPVTILAPAPIPCLPLDCAVVDPRSVSLTVASVDPAYGLGGYVFQVDTLPTFQSPGLVISEPVVPDIRIVTWSPSLSVGATYWWRCRGEHPQQLGAWCLPRSLTPEEAPGARWKQTATGQFAADSLWQAEAQAGGVRLLQESDREDVARLSQGATVEASSYLASHGAPENLIGGIVGNTFGSFLFADNDQDQWAKVDLGQVRYVKRVGSAHQGEGMTRKAVWSYFGVESSTDDEVYHEWGHVGPFSTWGDSVPSEVYYEMADAIPVRYILFRYGRCRPTAPNVGSMVYEVYAFEPTYLAQGSCLSPVLGPSSGWQKLAWEPEEDPSTELTVSLFGFDSNREIWEAVPEFQNLTAHIGVPLESIDASRWPLLKLRADLSTSQEELTPQLNAWWVEWEAVPDLAVVEPRLSLEPFPPWPGQVCTVHAWIGNVGSEGVPGFNVVLSDSTQTGVEQVAAREVGWTPPGFEEEITMLWSATAGRHTLVLHIDPEDSVRESQEINNNATVSADVLPNLCFASDGLAISPSEPAEGDTVSVTCVVANQGTVASPPFLTRLEAGTQRVDSMLSQALSPGRQETLGLEWHTEGLWGKVLVQVVLDARDEIEEVREDDNVLVDTVRVLSRCDYVAQRVTVSNPLPPEGDPLLVLGVVGNGGEAPGGPAQVWFLWRNAATTDSLFADVWTDTLAGGVSETLQTWWPTAGKAGHDTIALIVDPIGAVPERDEGNNKVEAPLEVRVGVDLVASAESLLILPSQPVKLRSYQVHAGVRNASSLDVDAAFGVHLINSIDGEVGVRTVEGLAGRTTAWLVWDWRPQVAGPVVFHVVVDRLEEVDETNEANNRASAAAHVMGWPDLVVRSEDIHLRTLPLQQWSWPESVRVVTRNEGESSAESVVVELFLGDPQTQGLLLGFAEWPVLAATSQETCWVGWTEPPRQTEVSLYAVADRRQTVSEESEANNIAIRRVEVIADSLPPRVELRAEDSLTVQGDYLAPGSLLMGFVVDSISNPDPAGVELVLNGDLLDGSQYTITWQSDERLIVAYAVGQESGASRLLLRARDVAGNWSEQVGFAYTVAHALTIRDLYPFPSPATQSTAFTFRVSHCGTATVDLYNLGGRLVRRLSGDVEPPFASIPWDLTDEDGGRVAAGVYLYVLRVQGEDRAKERASGRVVVMGH